MHVPRDSGTKTAVAGDLDRSARDTGRSVQRRRQQRAGDVARRAAEPRGGRAACRLLFDVACEQDDEKDEDYTSGSDEESEDIDEGEMSEELFTVVKTREGFYKLM